MRLSNLGVLCTLFALSACGGGSPPGPGSSGPAGPDTTAPVITQIQGAQDGDTLQGSVPLRITARDNVAATQIRLLLNGTELGTATGSVLSFSFPTALFPNADYVLRVTAADAAGNASYPVELRLTFANGPDAPQGWPALSEIHVQPPPPAPANGGGGTVNEAPDLPTPFDDMDPPDPADKIPPSSILVLGVVQNQQVWDIASFDIIAMDDKQVYAVQVAVDGSIAGAKLGPQLHVNWDSNTVEDGPHELLLRAWDAGGNMAQSSLLFNVCNGTDNVEPRFDIHGLRRLYPGVQGIKHFQIPVIEDQQVEAIRVEREGVEVYRTTDQALDYAFDTTQVPDGLYLLSFFVSDTAGKSSQISLGVIVSNHPQVPVSGTMLAPNGRDPLPGFYVRVPMREASNVPDYGLYQAPHERQFDRDYAACTTGPDGRFQVELPPGARHLAIRAPFQHRLPWNLDLELDVTGPLELPAAQTTLSPAAGPRLGVVTGDLEDIPDWLAKVGYGEVDASGRLVPGTERFKLFDGNESLPDGAYINLPDLFAPGSPVEHLDALYICSGIHHDDWSAAAAGSQLRDWLTQAPATGGRLLYCGGTAYNTFEQTFPFIVDFLGSEDTAPGAVPEALHAAEAGEPLAAPVLVVEPFDAAWLREVGFSIDSLGHFTGPPLTAGWPDYFNIEQGYGISYPGLSLAGSEADHPLLLLYMLNYDQDVAWDVNLLPVPAQPSPQWTPQERLLELQLLTGWG
jgi:hypothetical protein